MTPPTDSSVLSRIHPHWIRLYQLDRYTGTVMQVPATSLLRPQRFDLFSKLFYIRHRTSRPRLARRVYLENLRSMVPDGKEPGKEEEKNSFAAHLRIFDELIDQFAEHDFDATQTIVPVGKDRVLFDGAHRIASLAFWGKDVTICHFLDGQAPYFDYTYYRKHWMSLEAADLTAFEGTCWLDRLHLLCIWPGGKASGLEETDIFYRRTFHLRPKVYGRLRAKTGVGTLTDNSRQGKTVEVQFILFLPRDSWKGTAGEGPTSLFRDKESVARIAGLALTRDGRRKWRGWQACPLLVERIRTELRFLPIGIHNWDNKAWLLFYKLASPVWRYLRTGNKNLD